jgi:GT2 family glycosyltransferase
MDPTAPHPFSAPFAPESPLPQALARALLAGGDGRPECERAAGLAESPVQGPGDEARDMAVLARDLRQAAFEADPLDAAPAAAVLALDEAAPFLDAPRRALARLTAAQDAPPADRRYLTRLLERREHAKAMDFLAGRLKAEPGNLFWPRKLASLALAEADFPAAALAAGHLRQTGPAVLAAVADLFAADAAFLSGDFQAAEARYAASRAACPLFPARVRRAEALVRLGRRAEAMDVLSRDLAARPWSVPTLLRLHDLARGLDHAVSPLPGNVALLVYTYSKAGDLDRTLKSLSEADLSFAPGVRLVVLDNGSADATPDVLSAWADRLGPDFFSRVDLPVNVGAPAARNWLMRHEAVQNAAYAAYLDDDADVPADFLGRLGAAVRDFPEAGVYGCRVVDAANPAHVQSADLFIEPLSAPPDEHAFSRAYAASRAHLHSLDMGRFDYLRPCASVTGCCHLFATRTLRHVGDFDIRLSPSQYDDLDHDLRCLLSGKTPVYQGHLRVLHRKRTGSQGRPGGSQYAMGFANQFKLHQFYSHDQFQAMADAAFQAARRDAAAKWEWLAEQKMIGAAAPNPARGK